MHNAGGAESHREENAECKRHWELQRRECRMQAALRDTKKRREEKRMHNTSGAKKQATGL